MYFVQSVFLQTAELLGWQDVIPFSLVVWFPFGLCVLKLVTSPVLNWCWLWGNLLSNSREGYLWKDCDLLFIYNRCRLSRDLKNPKSIGPSVHNFRNHILRPHMMVVVPSAKNQLADACTWFFNKVRRHNTHMKQPWDWYGLKSLLSLLKILKQL